MAAPVAGFHASGVAGALLNGIGRLIMNRFTVVFFLSAAALTGVAAFGEELPDGGFKLDKKVISGAGQIIADPQPDIEGEYYSAGTVVELTAAPSQGNSFSWWFGDVADSDKASPSVCIVMDSSKTVEAVFGAPWVFSESDGAATITDGGYVLGVKNNNSDITVTNIYAGAAEVLDLRKPVTDENGNPLRIVEAGGFSGSQSFTHIVLPDTLKTISASAFDGCAELFFVEPFLPDSLASIGANAFNNCTNLTGNLVLYNPDSSISIGNYAFCKTAVETVDVGDKITSLPDFCFSSCTALRSVILAETVKTLGRYCFSNCAALETVTPFLPESVTSLGQSVFANCAKLSGRLVVGFGENKVSVVYSGHFLGTAVQEAILGENITTIPSFQNCTSLTNLVMHDNITSMNSLSGCTNLKNITPFLPSAISMVGQQTFAGVGVTNDLILGFGGKDVTISGNLNFSKILSERVYIGPGVKTLNSSMFSNCSQLKEVYLPETITSVASGCFSGCSVLQKIEPFLPKSVSSVGANAFSGCSALECPLFLTGTNAVTLSSFYNNQGPFSGAKKIPFADLSGNVPYLAGGDFYGCSTLGEVILSDQLLAFNGTQNFYNCSALTNIYFRGGCPGIGEKTFSGLADRKVRMYVPLRDESWEAFEAENVVPLDEVTKAEYLEKYPGETWMPRGLFENSGVNLWYFVYIPEDSYLNTTTIIVR